MFKKKKRKTITMAKQIQWIWETTVATALQAIVDNLRLFETY